MTDVIFFFLFTISGLLDGDIHHVQGPHWEERVSLRLDGHEHGSEQVSHSCLLTAPAPQSLGRTLVDIRQHTVSLVKRNQSVPALLFLLLIPGKLLTNLELSKFLNFFLLLMPFYMLTWLLLHLLKYQ